MKLLPLVLLGLFGLALATNSRATPLPVQPAPVIPSTTTGMPGAADGSYLFNFSNAGESGVVSEEVFNFNGTLDFYYQITDLSSSTDSLSRFTVGGFNGVTTSVFYEPDTGPLASGDSTVTEDNAPSDATRHSATTIGFDFSDGLAPGQTSDWMEIITNSTATTPGSISVIDDFTSSTNMALGAEAVPEPPSWILLGFSGLAGLVFNFRRRRLAR